MIAPILHIRESPQRRGLAGAREDAHTCFFRHSQQPARHSYTPAVQCTGMSLFLFNGNANGQGANSRF